MATLQTEVGCKVKGGKVYENLKDNSRSCSSLGRWSDNGSPIGEWALTEWNNSQDLPMGVYLRLNEDNTFDLYQHTLSVMWTHYSGTFSLNGNTLTGTYSDGTKWAEYTIKYNEKADPKQIRLTRKGDSNDVAIYTATEIPDVVTDQANEVTRACSVEIEKFL